MKKRRTNLACLLCILSSGALGAPQQECATKQETLLEWITCPPNWEGYFAKLVERNPAFEALRKANSGRTAKSPSGSRTALLMEIRGETLSKAYVEVKTEDASFYIEAPFAYSMEVRWEDERVLLLHRDKGGAVDLEERIDVETKKWQEARTSMLKPR